MKPFFSSLASATLVAFAAGVAPGQHTGDIQVQAADGKVIVGSASLDAANNTLGVTIGERVFSGMLLSNYRGSDPGFNTDPTGSVILPAEVEGFGGGTNVRFDLLPIHVGSVVANFFYWDGLGDGGSPTVDDVDLVRAPSNVSWTLVDDDFDFITADGSDQFVPGGLVDQTRSSGKFHNHLIIAVDDGDGNITTTPDAGVYVASLQLRVDGYETSDPLFLMSRSFQFDPLALDAAAEWIDANYDALTGNGTPGDFNGDGTVDALDYIFWRDDNGATLEPEAYTTWAASYGATPESSAAGAAVPEPAGFVVILGLLATACGGVQPARERQFVDPPVSRI